jgi:hypothetical protein
MSETRQTCETCARWTRDPPDAEKRRSNVGYCSAGAGIRHEASSCGGQDYEPLAEADTDPAPGWYCDVCGEAQPADERPDDERPDRCNACWLQAELWAAGQALHPSRGCPYPWCWMDGWTPEDCRGCDG